MQTNLRLIPIVWVSLIAAACSSSSGGASPDAGGGGEEAGNGEGGSAEAGTDGGGGSIEGGMDAGMEAGTDGGMEAGTDGGPAHFVVSPASANVLTCSTQAFTVSPKAPVTWSVSPSNGSIDATGLYTAPKTTPSPNTVTVTATGASSSANAQVTLGTAFPSVPASIAGSTQQQGPGVFPHGIAVKGSRVYAVWASDPTATPSVQIARSDDGGATWKTPVTALQVTLTGSVATDSFSCPTVAIDASNPDVVYVYGQVSKNNLGDAAAQGAGGDTALLASSTDGGATFHSVVMEVGGSAGGPNNGWDQVVVCGDVVSPAPDAIVVEAPGGYGGDGNPDIAIWADANRGAGFASGLAADDDYVANGFTHALDNLDGNHGISVGSNGGTDDAGGVTEAPRLFSDGAGRLCITYQGSLSSAVEHTYVQCSDATATTFSAPMPIDGASADISSPVGAFGSNGAVAVLWTDGIGAAHLWVATSKDKGATFGTPVSIPLYQLPDDGGAAAAQNPDIAYDAAGILWVTYRAYDGGFQNRAVVAKSCDGGQTWSDSVLVNGPEANIAQARFPALAMTPGAGPHVLVYPDAAGPLAYYALAP